MLTNKLRKLLHPKQWEFCTPSPYSLGNGCFFTTSAADSGSQSRADQYVYLVANTGSIAQFNPREGGWSFLPASGAGGSFTSGACGEAMSLGMLGGNPTTTATGGTVASLSTAINLVMRLDGCPIRVVSGAGAGYVGAVQANTIGPNAQIVVTPASPVAFNATTVFQVFSGSLWLFNSGTTSVGFAVYDRATNAWAQKSVTGLPTSWGTAGQLLSMCCPATAELSVLSGATSTTIPFSGITSWQANGFANYQVRIKSGTGAGQIRKITANTAAGVATISAAWTTTPDATSKAVIETDEDAMYLLGNGSSTLYRYSISANAWTTVTPSAPRSAAPGAGMTATWVGAVDAWPIGNSGSEQRGRYIYSLRGAGTTATQYDRYDIASGAWSVLDYGGRGAQTYNNGTCSVSDGHGKIYIQHDGSGRIYLFDIAANELSGLTTNVYPQSTTAAADLMFIVPYIDGADRLDFLYTGRHSGTEMFRMMLF